MKFLAGLSITLGLCVLYKYSVNAFMSKKAKKFFEFYTSFITADKQPIDFMQKKAELKYIIEKSNLHACTVPVAENIGYGKVCTYQADVIESFPNKSQAIVIHTMSMIQEAIGKFELQKKEALNPFYWIDLVVFAPKHLINYIGIGDAKSVSSKMLNVILTVIWWAVCTLVTCFKNDIFNAIQFLIQKLSQ